jgi:Tetracyclin repressor-like, C-terminal domain
MSLYRDIRDKDDPSTRSSTGSRRRMAPRRRGRRLARLDGRGRLRLRGFLVGRPAALHVYLAHPVVSLAAVDRMNAMMRVLRQAGIDEEAARSAYGAVHTYTIGFAALEASRARMKPRREDVGDLARQLAAYATSRQFTEGLRYLLEGISGHADPVRATGRTASRAPDGSRR